MSFEIEVKFRVADPDALRRQLLSMGAVEGSELQHEDIYLAHPSRDFARTDEALRLRRVGAGNRVTYKGPKRGGPTKTREEIEIPFEEGPDALAGMRAVFERLGFVPVATIRKVRTPFHFGGPMEVTIDLAEGLGAFAEVEAIAPNEAGLAEAQESVLGLASDLGLVEVEPRSYLRMHLEARADDGIGRDQGSTRK